MHQQKFKHS